jgi:hypothetical protein
MSMLTDVSKPDDRVTGKTSCLLPQYVNDPRYASDSLEYVFALHNHPFNRPLSQIDFHFIEEMAGHHGWEAMTRNGTVRLAVIAFFSHSRNSAAPSCDGFYQYIPATREVMTWSQVQGQWTRTEHGILKWLDNGKYRIEKL